MTKKAKVTKQAKATNLQQLMNSAERLIASNQALVDTMEFYIEDLSYFEQAKLFDEMKNKRSVIIQANDVKLANVIKAAYKKHGRKTRTT